MADIDRLLRRHAGDCELAIRLDVVHDRSHNQPSRAARRSSVDTNLLYHRADCSLSHQCLLRRSVWPSRDRGSGESLRSYRLDRRRTGQLPPSALCLLCAGRNWRGRSLWRLYWRRNEMVSRSARLMCRHCRRLVWIWHRAHGAAD